MAFQRRHVCRPSLLSKRCLDTVTQTPNPTGTLKLAKAGTCLCDLRCRKSQFPCMQKIQAIQRRGSRRWTSQYIVDFGKDGYCVKNEYSHVYAADWYEPEYFHVDLQWIVYPRRKTMSPMVNRKTWTSSLSQLRHTLTSSTIEYGGTIEAVGASITNFSRACQLVIGTLSSLIQKCQPSSSSISRGSSTARRSTNHLRRLGKSVRLPL